MAKVCLHVFDSTMLAGISTSNLDVSKEIGSFLPSAEATQFSSRTTKIGKYVYKIVNKVNLG